MSTQSKDCIHKGHRDRMKERFLANGFNGFSKHEIMEFVLFFAIPQGNVNPLAHDLINRFGNITGILTAGIKDILSVKGIGYHSAIFLKMIPELFKVFRMEQYEGTKKPIKFDDVEFMGRYFTDFYTGAEVETASVALLNEKFELITVIMLSDGNVNACPVMKQTINNLIIKHNAKVFVIAHNHPDGNPEPSEADCISTSSLEFAFKDLGVPMYEHIIVAGSKWYAVNKRIGGDCFRADE